MWLEAKWLTWGLSRPSACSIWRTFASMRCSRSLVLIPFPASGLRSTPMALIKIQIGIGQPFHLHLKLLQVAVMQRTLPEVEPV